MRKILTATALLLALGCPALAGEIHNPKSQPAPVTTQETNAGGEMPNGLTETMLSVIESLLALL